MVGGVGRGKVKLGDGLLTLPISLGCGRRGTTRCGLGAVMGRDAVGWWCLDGGWSLVESAEQLGVAAGKSAT